MPVFSSKNIPQTVFTCLQRLLTAVVLFTLQPFSTFAFSAEATALSSPEKPPESVLLWRSKAKARHSYESAVLDAALASTRDKFGPFKIKLQRNEKNPHAESVLFSQLGYDVIVTTVGNPKLKDENKIMIETPIMKGLLGQRLIVIRNEDLQKFSQVKSEEHIKKIAHGIPESWVDANLFRHNGYNVVEKGNFDDIFQRLKNKEFDYVALGANEIEQAFKKRALPLGELSIEPNIMIHYPFNLVFYVNPAKTELAERIREGLVEIEANGKLDSLYAQHFGELTKRLALDKRTRFSLDNPVTHEVSKVN